MKTIACDLDGTLAQRYRGDKIGTIGKPVPQVVAQVKRALARGYTVYIFTARLDQTTHTADSLKEQEDLISAWTFEQFGVALPMTSTKLAMFDEFWDDKGCRIVKNEGESTCGGEVWDSLMTDPAHL